MSDLYTIFAIREKCSEIMCSLHIFYHDHLLTQTISMDAQASACVSNVVFSYYSSKYAAKVFRKKIIRNKSKHLWSMSQFRL